MCSQKRPAQGRFIGSEMQPKHWQWFGPSLVTLYAAWNVACNSTLGISHVIGVPVGVNYRPDCSWQIGPTACNGWYAAEATTIWHVMTNLCIIETNSTTCGDGVQWALENGKRGVPAVASTKGIRNQEVQIHQTGSDLACRNTMQITDVSEVKNQ